MLAIGAAIAICSLTLHAQEKNRDVEIARICRLVSDELKELKNARLRDAYLAVLPIEVKGEVDDYLKSEAQLSFDHFLIEYGRQLKPPAYHMVAMDRRDEVYRAQRDCNTDIVSPECAIELGKNLAASMLVYITLTKDSEEKNWFKVHVQLIDASNGSKSASYRGQLFYKGGKSLKSPKITKASSEKQAVNRTIKPPRPPRSKEGFELRPAISYENYFDAYRPSAGLEIANRDSKVDLSLRLGYMPGVINLSALPFDIGHVVGIQATQGLDPAKRIITVGTQVMRPNELMLLSRDSVPLLIEPYTGGTDEGITGFEFDRIRMSDVRAARYSVCPVVRLYLGETGEDRPAFKLFAEAGLGIDYVVYRANFNVTRYKVAQQSDLSYLTTKQTQEGLDRYEYDSYRKNLFLGTFHFGLGGEKGRFCLAFAWRSLIPKTFGGTYKGYKRIKGDIIAMPAMNETESNSNSIRLALENDGAVRYGATNIQAEQGNTRTGNGVGRFMDTSNFMITLAFRI